HNRGGHLRVLSRCTSTPATGARPSGSCGVWCISSTCNSKQDEEMTIEQSLFTHVQYSWDDSVADRLDPLDRLVYRSNLLGADGRITNTGGGNTSAKLTMPDPLTGQDVEVLWVKGSGGDLRTAKRDLFASLYLAKLRGLQQHYHHAPERGPKS